MRIAPAAARLEAMNAGREQGKRPFPIVNHCVWCADWGGEVLPGDDVVLEDDDEAGLTFMGHAYCVEEGMAALDGSGVGGLRARLGWMREAITDFEALLALYERLRLEAAAVAIRNADGWLSHAKGRLSRFYRLLPAVPGFPGFPGFEKPGRGLLIELVDAGKELERVREDRDG